MKQTGSKKIILYVIRFVILALAAGLILFGAKHGGVAEVFHKAIMICYECIGIG